MSKTKVKKANKVQGQESIECIITDRGMVLEKEICKEFQINDSVTKQIDNIEWGEEIIQPPYNLVKLLAWMNQSVVHSSCVRVKTQDAVGVGWYLEVDEDEITDEEKDKDIKDNSDYQILYKFFKKVNPDENITKMIKKVFLDYEANGNGYIEVTRDVNGVINGLYHMNSGTIWWAKDKKRLCQIVGENQVWFKLFGSDEKLNSKTGNFVKSIKNIDDTANEIIPITQYTWMSSVYGLPEWLPAIYSMFGDVKETEYNIDFFLNFGVPAYAVIIEGQGAMDPKVKEEIEKYFETTLKGTGSNHKTLTLSTPKGVNIRFEKLNVEEKEASFRAYHKDNRDTVLMAHHVPPYRIGMVEKGQLGGSVASETDRIYLDSVINPRQEVFSFVLTEMVCKLGFGISGYIFKFKDINIYDEERDSKIAEKYVQNGIFSRNEIRKEKGLDPFKGGDIITIGSGMTPIGVTEGSKDVIETEIPEEEEASGQEEIEGAEEE